jgi:hypothetical protein
MDFKGLSLKMKKMVAKKVALVKKWYKKGGVYATLPMG